MVDALLLAPAFEYLPGLLAPDDEHARLVALARRHQQALGARVLELGLEGRTAAESAERVRALGARRVLVLDVHSDRSGAAALCAACAAAGLEVVRASEHAPWLSLAGAPPPAEPEWGARHGFAREAARAELLARATREQPTLLPWVRAVLEFHALGLHPLAEMYAGNGLADVNARYLENLA